MVRAVLGRLHESEISHQSDSHCNYCIRQFPFDGDGELVGGRCVGLSLGLLQVRHSTRLCQLRYPQVHLQSSRRRPKSSWRRTTSTPGRKPYHTKGRTVVVWFWTIAHELDTGSSLISGTARVESQKSASGVGWAAHCPPSSGEKACVSRDGCIVLLW